MKFIKDPAVMHIIKFSLLILLTMIGLFLVPTYAATLRDAKYLKDGVMAYEETDFDYYLEEIAAYYSFYYDIDPVIDHMIIDDGDVYLDFSVYAVSFYQEDNIGDSLQFFIHEAKYKGEDYKTLNANILFEDEITGNVTKPKDPIYYLNLNQIRRDSIVKSFFVTDFKKDKVNTELNMFKSVELYINSPNKKADPIPFVVFTDDLDVIQNFPIVLSLEGNNLNRDRYNISSGVANKETNIPTDAEQELHRLQYKEFNYDVLKPYNTIYKVIIIIYIIFYIVVLYLLFMHNLIMLRFGK